ncbi:MAG: hypothetical protein WDA30_24735 [Mycolicibacterium sp.]
MRADPPISDEATTRPSTMMANISRAPNFSDSAPSGWSRNSTKNPLMTPPSTEAIRAMPIASPA